MSLRLLWHLGCSVALAAAFTAPLPIAGRSAHPLLLAAATVLFFLLNLNLIENALADLTGRTPGRPAPKRWFHDGIPDSERTVIVYPILFGSAAEVDAFVRDSLIRSMLANPDPNAIWVVVSGSPGAIAARERRAIAAVREHAPDRPVLYLHRHPRVRNWERKRGAYMHLMRWLVDGCDPFGRIGSSAAFPAMPSGRVFDRRIGDPAIARGAVNLLVGDSDTRWPPGSVERLVSRIAHPANSRFVIFQGRIVPHNGRASVLSHVQRLLDELFRSQQSAIGRIYGRGLFTGHGAGWKIRRFLDGIAGRMPDGFLSHDIVESYFLPTLCVPEVETTEEVQETVPNLVRQWRRWWRGNRIATLRLLGAWRTNEWGDRVPNRNPVGKLLLLHADRNFLAPCALGGYLVVLAALAARGELASGFFIYGMLHLAAIMLRFYLPLIARVSRGAAAREIGFTLVFLTLLAHVLLVEKVRVVLRDLRAVIAAWPGSDEPEEWVVQSSLPRERSLRSALRLTWAYPIATSALFAAGLLLIPRLVSPFTVVPLAILGAAPMLVWYAAQPPPGWLLGRRAARAQPSEGADWARGGRTSSDWRSRTASCGAWPQASLSKYT